jgi:hypothetical protein
MAIRSSGGMRRFSSSVRWSSVGVVAIVEGKVYDSAKVDRAVRREGPVDSLTKCRSSERIVEMKDKLFINRARSRSGNHTDVTLRG